MREGVEVERSWTMMRSVLTINDDIFNLRNTIHWQVFAQSSPTNCTVYAGGCTSGDENALRRAFGHFGRIMKVWYFKDKGYAFVRYDNKESACNAIVALHLTEVATKVI